MPELEFEVSEIFGMIMQPTLSFMSYPMDFEVSKYFILLRNRPTGRSAQPSAGCRTCQPQQDGSRMLPVRRGYLSFPTTHVEPNVSSMAV